MMMTTWATRCRMSSAIATVCTAVRQQNSLLGNNTTSTTTTTTVFQHTLRFLSSSSSSSSSVDNNNSNSNNNSTNKHRRGIVTKYGGSFGFIRDLETGEDFFVHRNEIVTNVNDPSRLPPFSPLLRVTERVMFLVDTTTPTTTDETTNNDTTNNQQQQQSTSRRALQVRFESGQPVPAFRLSYLKFLHDKNTLRLGQAARRFLLDASLTEPQQLHAIQAVLESMTAMERDKLQMIASLGLNVKQYLNYNVATDDETNNNNNVDFDTRTDAFLAAARKRNAKKQERQAPKKDWQQQKSPQKTKSQESSSNNNNNNNNNTNPSNTTSNNNNVPNHNSSNSNSNSNAVVSKSKKKRQLKEMQRLLRDDIKFRRECGEDVTKQLQQYNDISQKLLILVGDSHDDDDSDNEQEHGTATAS